MAGRLRAVGKACWLVLHRAGARCGFFILPKHYYVPLPDLRELDRDRRWTARSSMRGVAYDLDRQIEFLIDYVAPFEPEYRGGGSFLHAQQGGFGPGFGFIEAQALHGFVRAIKPARIVEIGSGVSTFCMLEALQRNAAEGAAGALTCVEPYPSDWLRGAPVRLLPERVEACDPTLFDELDAGDLLFIDSSHTLRTGGDVLHILLEVIPRLRPGVYVHLHDIFLPYDYQRDADRSLFQWQESAMLHALLIGNAQLEIVACLSQLHYDRSAALGRVFPDYVPAPNDEGLDPHHARGGHFPSSIYLMVGGRAPVAPPAGPDQRRYSVSTS